MKKQIFVLGLLSCLLLGCEKVVKPVYDINITFNDDLDKSPKDGRLLLMLSTDNSDEPRFQINAGLNTQIIFGLNVDDWEPNTPITFNASTFGYPYASLKDVPPGEYHVQALLNVYETFNLSTRE